MKDFIQIFFDIEINIIIMGNYMKTFEEKQILSNI